VYVNADIVNWKEDEERDNTMLNARCPLENNCISFIVIMQSCRITTQFNYIASK
jgi:hypothetical protein